MQIMCAAPNGLAYLYAIAWQESYFKDVMR